MLALVPVVLWYIVFTPFLQLQLMAMCAVHMGVGLESPSISSSHVGLGTVAHVVVMHSSGVGYPLCGHSSEPRQVSADHCIHGNRRCPSGFLGADVNS